MSDTTEEQQLSASMKWCAVCAEPIRKEAVKCKHCGSYQSWRGRINFSSTVLSLLVALIAVIGATAPIIKNLFTPNAATLRFSEPTFGQGTVSVTATNIGVLPATPDWAFITIPQKSAGQPYIFDLRSSDALSDRKIGPGETKTITYAFDHKRFDPPRVTAEDQPCTIEIFSSIREVSCDEIRYMADNTPHPVSKRGLLPEEGPRPLDHPAHWE
jgi:hypothetical protein